MQDSTLLTLALIVAVVGVLCLAFLAPHKDGSENPYTKEAGEKITVQGELVRVTAQPVGARLRVLIPIDIMVFGANASEDFSELTPGTSVKVVGSVQEYQGRPEVIAESVATVKTSASKGGK